MTQQHLIELIQDDHPDKGDAHLRVLINDALAEFCTETRLLKGAAELDVTPGELRVDLPTDHIYAERLFDEGGCEVTATSPRSYMRLTPGEAGWWVDGSALVIGYFKDGTAGQRFVPFTKAHTFTLEYVRQAEPLTTGTWTDELPIPKEFHRALRARVLEQLAVAHDPNERRYWHAVWRDQVRKAARQANRRGKAFYDHLPMHEI